MTDPRLLGVLERLTYALEEHVKLLREALLMVEELAGQPLANEDLETPAFPEEVAGVCSLGSLYGDALHDRARMTPQNWLPNAAIDRTDASLVRYAPRSFLSIPSAAPRAHPSPPPESTLKLMTEHLD